MADHTMGIVSPAVAPATGTVRLDDITWHYSSEAAPPAVTGAGDPVLEGAVVKDSHCRRVIHIPDAGVYIKEICYGGVRSLLKGFGRGNACYEGAILRRLGELGISAAEPLAYGEVRGPAGIRRDVLVTRAITETVSLGVFCSEQYDSLSFEHKVKVQHGFADFVRRLHDEGIDHYDLHTGNILIRFRDGDVRFFLIDTYRVEQRSRPLTIDERIGYLGRLLAIFWGFDMPARFRFLKRYGGILDQRDKRRGWIADITKHSFGFAWTLWGKHARRCLAENSRFTVARRGAYKTFCLRRHDLDGLIDELSADPDRVLQSGTYLKQGNSHTVARVTLNGHDYVLKRYNRKRGLVYTVANAFRRAPAVRDWLVSWEFTVRGVPVPKALVCLEQRRGGLLLESFVLAEYLEETVSLADLWPGLDADRRRALLHLMIGHIRKLYRSGGFHRDLKWHNILVRTDDTGRFKIFFVDVDGSYCFAKPTPTWRRQRDVDRFCRNFTGQADGDKWEGLIRSLWLDRD